jgi:flagellar transcriptional activator FlhD
VSARAEGERRLSDKHLQAIWCHSHDILSACPIQLHLLDGHNCRRDGSNRILEKQEMKTEQLMAEIREANLSYLMLAQSMIRDDKEAAIFRLGVSEDVANIIERLSQAQLVRMAASNMLLFRFRFDDRLIVGMLSDHGSGKLMAGSHAAVLMADRPAAGLTA